MAAKKKAAPVAKPHTCGVCGKKAEFGPGWRWPLIGLERGYFDDRLKDPVCSFECEAKLLGKAIGIPASEAYVDSPLALHAQLVDKIVTETPASRIEMVVELLNPHDEDGNALPPIITREQALALLNAPMDTSEMGAGGLPLSIPAGGGSEEPAILTGPATQAEDGTLRGAYEADGGGVRASQDGVSRESASASLETRKPSDGSTSQLHHAGEMPAGPLPLNEPGVSHDGDRAVGAGDSDAGRGAVAYQGSPDDGRCIQGTGAGEGESRESAEAGTGTLQVGTREGVRQAHRSGVSKAPIEESDVRIDLTEPYEEFLSRKALIDVPTGIENPPALSSKLKEHQRLLVEWALRRGRAAIFADTGLGKGWMILEWARIVAEHTGKPALILAPLAVSQQFAREAERLETTLSVCYGPADVQPGINVTNYQKLHKFDASVFGGVAIDESSILKSLDGSTRKLLIESFRQTPFRLAATATPSPNDHTELGGHAEFLGVMSQQEMLASFFVHDGGSVQDWRLKGHAREAFWQWVCSWGAIVKMPSDLECSDDGYLLPPLNYREHIIPASHEEARQIGLLFAQPAETLIEQRKARRGTLDARVAKAAEILNASDGQGICWCDLNVESESLAERIKGSVEITGSMTDFEKETAIAAFVAGRRKVLVSKPTLCGWGLNLQFARNLVFCGVTYSFEAFYQAVRRSWRFGVAGEVNVHVVSSELEGNVVAALKEKQRKAEEIAEETRPHVSALVRRAVKAVRRDTIAYAAPKSIVWPSWFRTEVAA